MSIRILQGDCRDVLKTLPDNSVDSIVTDPPYAIHGEFGKRVLPDGATRTLQFSWDTGEAIREAIRVLKRPGSAFVFCGLDSAELARDELRAAGMTVKPWCWTKPYPPPPAPGNWWPSAFELAMYAYDSGAWFGDKDPKRRNYWHGDTLRAGNSEKAGHPTQKPLALMHHIVSALVPPGGLVLDPFAGSGSTLLAAKQLGRCAIGIELDPDYVQIARRRIASDAPLFAEIEL